MLHIFKSNPGKQNFYVYIFCLESWPCSEHTNFTMHHGPERFCLQNWCTIFFLFVLRHCLTLLLWVAWNSPRRWDLTEIHLPLPLEINSVLHCDWPSTILERPYSAFIKLRLCLKTQVRTYCLKGLILYMYENRFFRSCPCHLAGMYLVQEGGWHSAFISSKLKHQYNFYTLLKLSTY